ncbi:restriction endonuclease [Nitratidesulfovibrio sp. HK-II]|jgi:hypothetical protein|uniref:hypothetical protein n=1 Tax=Nitratidesulfovibrio sp. HK-II TaxID=2009266 RepID=UPI000E2EF572|nr:hypothetical protein [Nitratidesulfovibrio sp. HK-II]GBO97220.1 hypothetical protein RVX_2259 [Nitratidesulfovibrio sp. HK-II]
MSHVKTIRAIRRFCLDCQGGVAREVRLCPDTGCGLYAWRLAGIVAGGVNAGKHDPTGDGDADANPAAGDPVDPSAGDPLPGALPLIAQTLPDERPVRAIRRYCVACCGGERSEVRTCDARDRCALWSYRFGVLPETYRRVKARLTGPRALVLPGLPTG